MLSVIDIIRSLTVLLRENFQYPTVDYDVEEGFPRPCYFIDVDSVTGSNITSRYVQEESQLTVYFFEEDNYKGFLKLLQMKDSLLELFAKPLEVEKDSLLAHVLFDDVSVDVSKVDKVLSCTMSTVLIQERDEEYVGSTSDYDMEELDVNL